MAGWAPPSRSMATPARQLPAVPQQNINSVGLPSAYNSYLPPEQSSPRSSLASLSSSHSYSRQPSESHLLGEQRSSMASLSSSQSYSRQPLDSHLVTDQRSSLASLASNTSSPRQSYAGHPQARTG